VRSLRKVGFHAYVAGNKVNFLVDIIPGDLPFLISLKMMRERGFIIDCEGDTVSIRMKTGLVIAPVRVGDNGHHYWLALEHFIKGYGFEDDSEDTVDEEMMKQDEAPKNQEVIKKELFSC
jgi:hypothetical protein